MVVVRGKRNQPRSLSVLLLCMAPRIYCSADTNTQLVRSLQEHLRYFLLIYTLLWSSRPLAIGMYYHYPRPRSKTVGATLPVRSTANGAGAVFPLPRHPRWPGQGGTCRKLRLSVMRSKTRLESELVQTLQQTDVEFLALLENGPRPLHEPRISFAPSQTDGKLSVNHPN